MRLIPLAQLLVISALVFPAALRGEAREAPNILWITADDMSPTLAAYGDDYATTPHLDRLARQSVRYTNAFATAPVCSPSRSTLITGRYAPSLGTHEMRSVFPIPDSFRGFPALLREQGYYTSNNVKTDYNTANWKKIIEASWDESSGTAHWRNRDDDSRPFFSVFNLMTSHQSRAMVWPRERFLEEVQSRLTADEIHDPAEVPVPPYSPDTAMVRQTLARYYDSITAMDKEVGRILAALEEDGLADNTIVFFYSDHGSGLPRHKRALLDTGMHVPLLVRFPEKYRHSAPAAPGEAVNRPVSFVDFGPTVLSLADVEIPETMQGRPFLGNREAAPRDYIYGHRDRVDEVFDRSRSVRDDQYLYIRNYMPHLGYNQPSAWPDQGTIRREFYRLADPRKMTAPQWHFAGPARPAEELYDCEADPQNLHNLADSPKHRETLERMREAHRRHLIESRDVGFLPESEAWKAASESTLWEAARDGYLDLEPLYEAAEQVGLAGEEAFLANLDSPKPGVRYWGAIGLAASETLSGKARDRLKSRLDDSSMAVRIEAANALARHGAVDQALPTLIPALRHESLTVVLHATRTIELLGEAAEAAVPAIRKVRQRARAIRPEELAEVQPGRQDLAMFIDFSANAFLSRIATGEWIDLFDGETLDDWSARAPGKVTAANGEIQMLAEGDNLWLVHEDDYADFELMVEAKMPETYNSGIGFRCSGDQGKPVGYQCEIDGPKSGMLYAIGSGWVSPEGDEERQRFREKHADTFREGDWNTFRIRCEGDRTRIWVNGIQTTDTRDSRFGNGAVALQHHGRGGLHRFRHIQIRELNRR